MTTRRSFLQGMAAAGGLAAIGKIRNTSLFAGVAGQSRRSFHVCLSGDALDADPKLPDAVRDAGVGHIWMVGFMYGHRLYDVAILNRWRARLEKIGIALHIVQLALGHPGDSLGASSGKVPLTPPKRWRLGTAVDGSTYVGTSLHPPATAENVASLRELYQAGFHEFFLDDDFRLARSPGQIGGCFCDIHRGRFLKLGGYAAARWDELRDDVRGRRLTPLLRAWVNFTCDDLTASFRSQREAVPEGFVAPMVMYLGGEKAGIRLTDYRGMPMRVGEWMFDDGSFGRTKGKTDELFSCLFHRRFVRPEQAYSETTAFPANALSPANLAAKLIVSTLADVRNTMLMSGLTPFPRDRWAALQPAMIEQARVHAVLAGHRLRGPFKHYHGEAARFVGDDNPFSLFLATGVPFEVADELPTDGWTFLGDADAASLAAGTLDNRGTTFIARGSRLGMRPISEDLPALFKLKHELLPKLTDVPYVEQEEAVVCAWYPTARALLLWNLTEQPKALTVRLGETRREVHTPALGTALLTDIGR
jgi:hypothetical protein